MFEDAKYLALIKEFYGSIHKPSRILEETYTLEPTQDGEREVVLRRVGDIQAVLAAYHIPAGTHPDFAALEVLDAVLNAAPSGRLYKGLVETKKAISAGGFNFQLHDPGVALLTA